MDAHHERIRLAAPDAARPGHIDDPVVSRSLPYTYAYRKMSGYKMVEFVCENNREYRRAGAGSPAARRPLVGRAKARRCEDSAFGLPAVARSAKVGIPHLEFGARR
jgi:hypothetical protein